MVFHSIHDPRDAQEEIFRHLNDYRTRRAEKDVALQSQTVVDALLAYDRIKQPAAAQTGPTPPTPVDG